LLACADPDSHTTAHLERLLGGTSFSAADRGLATELALGLTRRLRTCRALVRAFLKRPNQKLPRPVETVLDLAVYQLILLDRIPAFAAINEAVNQVGRHGRGKMRGMVNGVLRSVQRSMSEPQQGACPMDPSAVPIDAGRWMKLDRAVFPDPQKSPAAWLSQAYSLPDELVDRWVEQAGSPQAAQAWCAHTITRAPLIARVNTLRADVPTAIETLAEQGVTAQPHENGRSVVIDDSGTVTELAAFQAGLIQPQDPTATAVVDALDPHPGMTVLDLCAAPGTKTTHIAERMNNTGRIVACDVSEEKLARVTDNAQRMGIDIIETLHTEQAGGLDLQSFDCVLADVPCSNTGVLARRAEARWHFDRKTLSRLADDQKFLAAMAGRFLKPGGKMVYSTCSIEPEENRQVVRHADRHDQTLHLKKQDTTPPGGAEDPKRWHDGGFCAILKRE
jgi:16S rRNA (cytosine967-C5)-methyltransferase